MDSPNAAKAEKGRYCDRDSFNAPARHCFEVTPDDNDELPHCTRGLMVSVAGNVRLVFEADQDDNSPTDTDVTLPLLAKTYYPFAVKQIYATDTTATGIFAFY